MPGFVGGEQPLGSTCPPRVSHDLSHLAGVQPGPASPNPRVALVVRRDEKLAWLGLEQFIAFFQAWRSARRTRPAAREYAGTTCRPPGKRAAGYRASRHCQATTERPGGRPPLSPSADATAGGTEPPAPSGSAADRSVPQCSSHPRSLLRSLPGAQPLNWLAGDLGYYVEVLADVQDREPSHGVR